MHHDSPSHIMNCPAGLANNMDPCISLQPKGNYILWYCLKNVNFQNPAEVFPEMLQRQKTRPDTFSHNELSGWLGKQYGSLHIITTYNLLYNASLMVEEIVGCAFSFFLLFWLSVSSLLFPHHQYIFLHEYFCRRNSLTRQISKNTILSNCLRKTNGDCL